MSTRPRNKHNETPTSDKMKQETVVQVHKIVKSSSDSCDSDKRPMTQNLNIEDPQQDQIGQHNTPSRDISVDGESQINSKIISLIESEMKRGGSGDSNNKTNSHFTDSRPQSLSFYEDEKIPEELSGDLELLSPEERKHYSRSKRTEINGYVIQDLYSTREGDEIMSSLKKSKSRKKRHGGGDSGDLGLGDSREMMIPKEKKKSKKKKRESSPTSRKNKHNSRNKRDFDDEPPRNEITVVLDELQDDVFENGDEQAKVAPPIEKVRKSPRKSDKIYVQKKNNKFEAVPRTHLNRQGAYDFGDGTPKKRHPLDLAIPFQQYWMRFSTLCHGLLGGLALGHFLFIISNIYVQDNGFISHYSHFSDIYTSFFYFLCVVCLISVFEKVDFAHSDNVKSLLKFRKSTCVIVVYFTCLVVHLVASKIDYKIGLVSLDNETISDISQSEISEWNHLSIWRSVLAFTAWVVVGLSPEENTFYLQLKNMEKYLPVLPQK